MNTTQSSEISLIQLALLIGRHWRLSASFFTASVLVTVCALWVLPRSYRSEGKLYIRLGRESASLDATAVIGRSAPAPSSGATRENEINSVVEILQSRVLIERVVDSVGPAAILTDSDPSDDGASQTAQAAITPGSLLASATRQMTHVAARALRSDWRETLSERDKAILELQKMIDVEAIKKSDVVRVSCESGSPKLAQTIVSSLVDSYLAEHFRLNRTGGAYDFLEQQTAETREKLAGVEEELRKLKDQTGLASPDIQRDQMVNRAARLEDEVLASVSALASAEAEAGLLREQVATLPKTTVTAATAGIPNQGPELMRNELYRLQMVEQELTSKYTDEHFALRQIRDRVSDAKKALDAVEKSHDQVTSGPNGVYEQTHLTLVKQEPVLLSLRTKADTARSQLAQVREEIKVLNANEQRIARLTREVKQHESNYQTYAQHLEQTRIDQALEAGRISSINIIQPATFEPKPVAPRVLMALCLGLAVGLIGAVGLPLVAGSLERPVAAPLEVEAQAQVAALAIPSCRSEQLAGNGEGS